MNLDPTGRLDARLTETELYRIGTLDSVTSLPNRLFFVDLLKYEMERSRRTKVSGTFVMILLDGGWVARKGEEHDAVVGAVARVLRRIIRTTDLVARLGSDRFGVYLPMTDFTGAREFAERVRKSLAVASRAIGHGHSLHTSAHFGLADAADSHFRTGNLLQAADRASSQAKLLGPGQIAVASRGAKSHG